MVGFRLAAGVAGVFLVAGPVLAQFPPVTDPGKGEQKCESSTGKALTKQVGSSAKCAAKCITTQRKVVPPVPGQYADCFPPFGGPTLACLSGDPLKSATAKAAAAIIKACTDAPGKDNCPECYGAATCTTGNPFVATTAALTGAQGQFVYCTEAADGTPSKDEGKCEDGLSKTLVKWVGTTSKCYTSCYQNEAKGKIMFGTCTPPATDPATQTCLTTGAGKTNAALDKACFGATATAPACYDGTPTRPNTSAAWTTLTQSIVEAQTPTIACGA